MDNQILKQFLDRDLKKYDRACIQKRANVKSRVEPIKELPMQKLSPMRFGIALGVAGAIFYVVCMIFMAVTPHNDVVWLSNALLHGVDIQSVMRESVPLVQSLAGIASTFVGGLIFGSLSACVYNFGLGSKASAQ